MGVSVCTLRSQPDQSHNLQGDPTKSNQFASLHQIVKQYNNRNQLDSVFVDQQMEALARRCEELATNKPIIPILTDNGWENGALAVMYWLKHRRFFSSFIVPGVFDIQEVSLNRGICAARNQPSFYLLEACQLQDALPSHERAKLWTVCSQHAQAIIVLLGCHSIVAGDKRIDKMCEALHQMYRATDNSMLRSSPLVFMIVQDSGSDNTSDECNGTLLMLTRCMRLDQLPKTVEVEAFFVTLQTGDGIFRSISWLVDAIAKVSPVFRARR